MTPAGSSATPPLQHYTVVPDRSAIAIEVTTSLGPITFGATGLEGLMGVAVRGAAVDLAVGVTAHLELQVRNLTSGNSAYDGELQRHIDARRFPAAYVDLHHADRVDGDDSSRYLVRGEVMFRGVTELVEGLVTVDFSQPGVMVVRGERALDIRLFEIPPPSVFMFKLEPEVMVSLQLEARLSS
ncbi:MAG: YceI family protein [Acidimicrobiia bacterium]